MRVDGSLVGIDEENTSLFPKWRRGSFSLVLRSNDENSRLDLYNHVSKLAFDAIELNNSAWQRYAVMDNVLRFLRRY